MTDYVKHGKNVNIVIEQRYKINNELITADEMQEVKLQ